MLGIDNLAKSHPARPTPVVALAPTSLAVEAGETVVLLGPTGSGKSTLLRLVAGLDAPTTGTVSVDGVDVTRRPPHKRGVAMLPQRPALYPDLTVEQNLRVGGGNPEAGVELLRLRPLLNRLPHQLSGGESQRVALAKLVPRPALVWLLDEPFGGLDAPFKAGFRADLHLLAAHCRATMVIVTHDPADAWAFGRRVGVLDSGRLVQLGPPAELRDDPRHMAVAASFGQVGFLSGRVGGGEQAGARVFVSDCGAVVVPLSRGVLPPADNLALGFRPDDVVAVPAGQSTPAQPGVRLTGWPVISAEPDGSGWRLTVASPGNPGVRLSVSWRSGSPPPVGTPTDWFVPAESALWFAPLTGERVTWPSPTGPDRVSPV